MVQIAPFRGLVYNSAEFGTSAGLMVAPPYDVLTPEQRDGYLAAHPHNILHLDLGEVRPDDPEPYSWHDRSARLLEEWIKAEVLVRSKHPSFYLVETDCKNPINGRRMVRHGFLALMRMERPGKGSKIRPHEKTFSSHKVERLDLMKKTGAQLSPVFGFFPDPDSRVLGSMYDMTKSDPDFELTDRNGLSHRISIVEDRNPQAALVRGLADKTIYIADGHHRYETALNYRDDISSSLLANGVIKPENSVLDFVMIYLCPMSDPGLCILPTHRLLTKDGRSNEEILKALEVYAEVKSFSVSSLGETSAKNELALKLLEDNKKGLSVFGLVLSGAKAYYFIKIREKIKEELVAQNPAEADLNALDVSILTNTIFKKALGLTEADMDNPDCLSYEASFDEAVSNVINGQSRGAFLLNPTSVDEILKVTEAGQVMPRKATFFYPKVTSGLVMNLIDPKEIVVIPAAF